MSLRVNIRYKILHDENEDQSTHIKIALSDFIAKAIENIEESESNNLAEDFKLVWAPWDNKSSAKAIAYTGEGSICKETKDLSWGKARGLLNRGWFGKKKKGDSVDLFRNVSIRLLYNGDDTDRDNIRSHLQRSLREIEMEKLNKDFGKTNVWAAKLHNHPKPKLAGRIFYSHPRVDLTKMMDQVIKTIQMENGVDVEYSLKTEPAFQNDAARNKFYDKYDSEDPKQQEQLDLRKCPTIYCDPKYASLLCQHMCLAFTDTEDNKYLTKGTHQRFIPEKGVMPCFDNNTPFNHFVVASSKVISVARNQSTQLEDSIQPESLYLPISNDPKSSFHYITPFNIIMSMPRSTKDANSAFFQVGTDKGETEIYAMTVPALQDAIGTFATNIPHYIKAYLKERGAESLIDRILTPEAVVLTEQFEYCMTNHKLKPVDKNFPIFSESRFLLKEFDDIRHEIEGQVQILPNPESIVELGSQASRHAKINEKKTKSTPKSGLSPKAKYAAVVPKPPTNTVAGMSPKIRLKCALKRLSNSGLSKGKFLESIKSEDIYEQTKKLFRSKKKVDLFHNEMEDMSEKIEAYCESFGVPIIQYIEQKEDDDKSVSSELTDTTNKTDKEKVDEDNMDDDSEENEEEEKKQEETEEAQNDDNSQYSATSDGTEITGLGDLQSLGNNSITSGITGIGSTMSCPSEISGIGSDDEKSVTTEFTMNSDLGNLMSEDEEEENKSDEERDESENDGEEKQDFGEGESEK